MNRAKNDEKDADRGLTSLVVGSTDSAAIEAYYDEWAKTYDATVIDWDYRTPDEAAATLFENLEPGANILDVGCGTGLFSKAIFSNLNCTIEGIDISAVSLQAAKNKGFYNALIRHDLQSIPLPADNDSFDAAACVGVLTYIEDAIDLLEDLCRVIRPGGLILFTQRDDRCGRRRILTW